MIMLDIGQLDREFLEKWLDRWFDITGLGEDILSKEIQELETENDFNNILYIIFRDIMNTIIDYIVENEGVEEEVKEKAEKIRDEFSPYLNYVDSWFNNIFDAISNEIWDSGSVEEITQFVYNQIKEEIKEVLKND